MNMTDANLVQSTHHYYLVAEYCPGPFYMGWHLYLRESKAKQKRNTDGGWGWLQYGPSQRLNSPEGHPAKAVFDALGIVGEIIGGGCDDGAIAAFARARAIPRQRIGGQPRGCVEVTVDEWDRITLA